MLKDSRGRKVLRYTEDTSKTRQGGLQHRRLTPKIVDAYENLEKPDRCVVHLFEKYCALRPKKCTCSALYLRPLQKPTPEQWFSNAPLGTNTLASCVHRLCAKAGLGGHRTNHSLTHWTPNPRGLGFFSPTLKRQTREVSGFALIDDEHGKRPCVPSHKVSNFLVQCTYAKPLIFHVQNQICIH